MWYATGRAFGPKRSAPSWSVVCSAVRTSSSRVISMRGLLVISAVLALLGLACSDTGRTRYNHLGNNHPTHPMPSLEKVGGRGMGWGWEG